MATLDALCTPPPASLSAVSSHQSLRNSCSLYTVSMAPEPNNLLESRSFEDLSSSDKENSPSYALHKQNRANSASPTMKAFSHSSPEKHYMSFTPQRVRPPPRAWERRPATPFIPRVEGQKIWKRVPLQDLGSDINQQISRTEKEERENYLRVIKRLRLDNQMNANEDVDQEQDPMRIAIGTKWGEEYIDKEGSPKKKLRTARSAMHESSSGAPTDQTLTKEDHDAEPPTIQASVQTPLISDSDQLQEELIQAVAAEDETVSENGMINEADDQKMVTELSTDHEEITGQAPKHITLPTNHAIVPGVNQATGSVVSKIIDSPSKRVSEYIEKNENLDATTRLDSATTTAVETKPNADHDETAFLRDFLERAQASKALKIALSPQKKATPVLQPILEGVQLDPVSAQHQESDMIDEIEDDDLSPPVETALSTEMLSIEASRLNSPTRRSARAATRASSSRLPRFQAPSTSHFGPVLPSQQATTSLPGTIQLKRASGGEFIFNARSQQTLAMTTKSNTKQNQNGAIHVPHRLAQLRKEFEARQQNEAAAALSLANSTSPVSEVVEGTEDVAKSTTKKRKRDRQEDGKPRKSRNVQWPTDDQLASYREPTPCPSDSETSDADADGATQLPSTVEETQPEKTTEPTAAEQVSRLKSSTAHKKPESTEETSKLKVRRIRKIKLDSVNGTPAPKTRSRSIPDPASTEQKPEQLKFDIAPSSRRSSRMPVPVSTPIPLPALGSDAKAKSGTDKENRKPAPTPLKPAKEVRGTKESKDVEERKLSGVRKLRGRT